MSEPAVKPTFHVGFTGSTLDAALPYAVSQIGDADRVMVAMAGSGKDIAYLAREGRTIYSYDPQVLSRLIVHGIFAASPTLEDPPERGESRGYASTMRPIHGMTADVAHLVDWIAITGNDYDRACLAKALIRSTYMGRLTAWSRDLGADEFWAKFLRIRLDLAEWRGLPGKFVHVQGSVFEALWFPQDVAGATLYIDTPKVLTGGKKGDIYSRGFEGLNSILAQEEQTLPAWTEATFRRDMPTLWQSDYQRMLMFYCSGARPAPDAVLELMEQYSVPRPSAVMMWTHRDRTDLCWVIDREVL